MAEQHYSNLIITRPREKDIKEFEEVGEYRKSNVYMDETIVPGGFYLQGTWIYKASDYPYPDEVHSHDEVEYLGFIGTNPDDPFDLGGEVELRLGGETYTLTETSMVMVPSGVEHCPIYFRRVDSPIWFFATMPRNVYDSKKQG